MLPTCETKHKNSHSPKISALHDYVQMVRGQTIDTAVPLHLEDFLKFSKVNISQATVEGNEEPIYLSVAQFYPS